jgi:hypothetical protein
VLHFFIHSCLFLNENDYIENAHNHKTCVSPTPIIYATYGVLAHSFIQPHFQICERYLELKLEHYARLGGLFCKWFIDQLSLILYLLRRQ